MGFNLGSIVAGAINPLALIGTAASVGGDLYSANQAREAQRDTNQANFENTAQQMAFQERMSSTSHQREVEDLKKAGLNPVLSANSGASTPVGASPDINPLPPSIPEGLGFKAASTAMQAMQMKKDFEQADAQIAATKASEKLQDRQAEAATESAQKIRAERLSTDIDNRKSFMDYEFDVNHPKAYWVRRMFSSMAPVASSARDAALLYKTLTYEPKEKIKWGTK